MPVGVPPNPGEKLRPFLLEHATFSSTPGRASLVGMNEAEALFQANPFAAVKFLRPLLLFGSVISSVLTVLTFRELHSQPPWWTAEGRAALRSPVGGASDNDGGTSSGGPSVLPLIWVWVQFTIMCVQWPIRLVLLRHILKLGTGTVDEAAAQLTGLARSRAWRGNQHLGSLHAIVCLVGACIYFLRAAGLVDRPPGAHSRCHVLGARC